MKEIEILVEVLDDVENVLKALDKFQYEGDKETIDVYYYDPLRDTLKPNSAGEINECLRVRTKNDLAYITLMVNIEKIEIRLDTLLFNLRNIENVRSVEVLGYE